MIKSEKWIEKIKEKSLWVIWIECSDISVENCDGLWYFYLIRDLLLI